MYPGNSQPTVNDLLVPYHHYTNCPPLNYSYHNETFIAMLKLFLGEKFQRGFVFGTERVVRWL